MQLQDRLIKSKFKKSIDNVFYIFGNQAPYDRPHFQRFDSKITEIIKEPLLGAVLKVMVIDASKRPNASEAYEAP